MIITPYLRHLSDMTLEDTCMQSSTSTIVPPTYWCIKYSPNPLLHQSKRYQIKISGKVTFYLLLGQASKVTKSKIVAFKYDIGDHKNIMIHSEESFKLAMEHIGDAATQKGQGGFELTAVSKLGLQSKRENALWLTVTTASLAVFGTLVHRYQT